MAGRVGCAEVVQGVLHNLKQAKEVVQKVVQSIYIAHLHNLPFEGFKKWKNFEVVQRLCKPIAGCTRRLEGGGAHNTLRLWGAKPAHTFNNTTGGAL